MRHKTNNRCDIIISAFICLLFFTYPADLYSKNNKKNASEKTRTDIVKEKSENGTVQTKDENMDNPDNTDKNKKDQTGLISKEYKDEDFKPVVEEESYGWLVVKTILILGTIVGLFYYFLKYVTKKSGINVLGTDAVQILSMVPIGQNKFLQIVDIAGKIYVLGVSEGSINLITEISDKSEIDRIRILSSKSGDSKGKGFHEYFTRHVSNIFDKIGEKKNRFINRKKESNLSDGEFDLNYLKQQRNRLKNLDNHDE